MTEEWRRGQRVEEFIGNLKVLVETDGKPLDRILHKKCYYMIDHSCNYVENSVLETVHKVTDQVEGLGH